MQTISTWCLEIANAKHRLLTTRKQAISGAPLFAISGALVVRHYYHATANF
jgi:hypothetical protein